jgi:hypothetical protein
VLVGAALLALAPAAPDAQATPGQLTFQWGVTPGFGSAFKTSGSWGAGTGTYHPASGETSAAYLGTVTAVEPVFLNLRKPRYGITLAEPRVSVDHTGAGALSMVVSSFDDPDNDGTHDVTTAPKRVVVTTFTMPTTTWPPAGGTTTLTVTPSGWTQAFLAQLTPTVLALFQGASPAEIRAEVDERTASEPTIDATVVDADNDRVRIFVQGLAYGDGSVRRRVTVGIAPSGAVDYGRLRFVAGVSYGVVLLQKRNSFKTELVLPSSAFDPALSYSAYTFEGAVRETSHLDAEARVALPFARMGFPRRSRTDVEVGRRPTARRAGEALVKVTGGVLVPRGTVRVTWRKGTTVKRWTRTLNTRGSVAQKLPPSPRGRWVLRVSYLGNRAYAPSRRRVDVPVG